ncbi:MAG: flagellar hook-length control protein FliK [Thiomonas sp.]
MLDPQTSAQEAVSRANLNTGIAAVSVKTLPLTAAMAAATSPLSRTEWPQPILPTTNSLASSESGTGPADANAGLANGMAASKFLGKDATHQDAQALPNAWSKGRLGPEDAARLSGSDNTDQPVSPKGALLAKATGEQPLNGGASLQRSDTSLAPGAASNTFPGALMPGALQLQAASPSAQTYTAALHVPVGAAPWGQELGRQMLFAVNGQQQLATLHLNPPQLGPLEVHLQLHDGQVNAQFVSPHQAVRQALESAMPQLHDLFTGAGLTLMQTSVDSGGTGRNMSQDRPSGSEGFGGVSASGNSARSNTQVPASQPSWKQGLVNTYV